LRLAKDAVVEAESGKLRMAEGAMLNWIQDQKIEGRLPVTAKRQKSDDGKEENARRCYRMKSHRMAIYTTPKGT
jgi:hypothetical protein